MSSSKHDEEVRRSDGSDQFHYGESVLEFSYREGDIAHEKGKKNEEKRRAREEEERIAAQEARNEYLYDTKNATIKAGKHAQRRRDKNKKQSDQKGQKS